MHKKYIVEQPQDFEQIIFLVDDINELGTRGFTDDISKIQHNLALLPDNFKIDLKVGMLAKKAGGITVFPYGKFIIRLVLNANETEGSMNLFDFTQIKNVEELNDIFKAEQKDSILEKYRNTFHFLKATYEEDESDIVKLLKVID